MNARHEYPFEKLRVWQKARELTKAVYHVTAGFPPRELHGLISQCNRAAVSVAANIAEGSARRSRKDQAHFSQIAYSSLMELACLLMLCVDIEILSSSVEEKLRRHIEEVSAQLNALHRAQRAQIG